MKNRIKFKGLFLIFIFIVLNSLVNAQHKKYYSNKELVDLLNKEVQEEINLVRQYPIRYHKLIEKDGRLDPLRYEITTNGTWFIRDKSEYFVAKVSTHEGISAYQEASKFLLDQEEMKPYKFNEGLKQEAKKQCEYIQKVDILTHARPDGEGLSYVMKLKGNGLKLVGEVLAKLENKITPGKYSDAELKKEIQDIAQEIVLGWIVDDGIKDRGHRKGLFHELHNYFGAYCLIDMHGTVICAVELSTLPM